MKALVLNIYGMACDNCAEHIEQRLMLVPGVSAAHVDLMSKTARVQYNESQCAPPQMIACVERTGYQVDGCVECEWLPAPAGA